MYDDNLGIAGLNYKLGFYLVLHNFIYLLVPHLACPLPSLKL